MSTPYYIEDMTGSEVSDSKLQLLKIDLVLQREPNICTFEAS